MKSKRTYIYNSIITLLALTGVLLMFSGVSLLETAPATADLYPLVGRAFLGLLLLLCVLVIEGMKERGKRHG